MRKRAVKSLLRRTWEMGVAACLVSSEPADDSGRKFSHTYVKTAFYSFVECDLLGLTDAEPCWLFEVGDLMDHSSHGSTFGQ